MRKKIGIVTISEGANYGNRLQNYALQQVLKKRNYKPETIRIKNSQTISHKLIIKNLLKIRCSRYEKRLYRFYRFNKKHLVFSKYILTSDEKNDKISDAYDVFVCGSDQIWNPFFKNNTDNMFLSFVNGKKSISVAASFGVPTIPEEKKEHIKKMLNNLDYISVREEDGKQIVEELTEKKVYVIPDPTFMLTAEEWIKIEKKPKKIKGIDEKYIFCYLLGKIVDDKQAIEEIKNFAKEKNLRIVFLGGEFNQNDFLSDEKYLVDPGEFIWLLHNSEQVITNSFHAVVFSLMFKKRFKVLKRENNKTTGDMSSRLIQIQRRFDIEDMWVNNGDYSAPEIDFSKIENEILEVRKTFNDYLDDSI